LLLFPVIREFLADTETPITIFDALRKSGACFLLESVERGERRGRYSMIGLNPVGEVLYEGDGIRVRGDIEMPVGPHRPLETLREIIKNYTINTQGHELPPFAGGLAGFLAYDILRYYERLPNRPPDDTSFPEAHFMLVRDIVVYDHLKSIIKIISLVSQDLGEEGFESAKLRIDDILHAIKANNRSAFYESETDFEVTSNFTKEKFLDAVSKAKEHITDGDILQVVLSQRLKCAPAPESFMVYRRLRSLNPSPYMFYIDFKDYCLVGSSPECLAKAENSIIETCPIAGTRPRGKTAQEDQALADELLRDDKERAEHIMLVDLGRNDIGRVSKIGTVSVEDYMHIERFSHVMHIVSNVKGQLEPSLDAFDALLACFPAGTVSGAPRLRAMEIIDELEPTARGPYAGAVGYFDFRGNMDTCIAIRSVFFKDNCAYLQAGAGIVADSVPGKEYAETLNKLSALLKALKEGGYEFKTGNEAVSNAL